MERRAFIAALGGAAAWPLAAQAQQSTLPVIAFLSPGSPEADVSRLKSLRQGLKETGYVESQNVAIEYRWARSKYDQLPALAADLVARQVAALVTVGTPAALAAKAATNTIPIVFVVGGDPAQLGRVSSLSRPGGNATGVDVLNLEVIGKRLELLHELVPAAPIIAFLANPKSALAEVEAKTLRAAGRALGIELRVLNAASENEIDAAFAILAKDQSTPLLVSADVMFTDQRVQLIVLAARHAVPTIYCYREFAAAGGLISYGPDLADAYRQIGVYTGRILKGAKPSELPAQQAVKVELAINLKTARALGITFPLPLLGRADEVID